MGEFLWMDREDPPSKNCRQEQEKAKRWQVGATAKDMEVMEASITSLHCHDQVALLTAIPCSQLIHFGDRQPDLLPPSP
jgi:hypothetical protein